MNTKTYLAVGELVQAAAHMQGVVGPVEFNVCRPRDYSDLPPETSADFLEIYETAPTDDFFYAQSFA